MNTKMTYEVVENAETFERMLARVREAQKVFATYTQEQVDKIFRAAAMAANHPAYPAGQNGCGGDRHGRGGRQGHQEPLRG